MKLKNTLFVALLLISLSAAARAQTDIRKVDFQNFTYPAFCGGDETADDYLSVTVKKGKFENVVLKNGVYETKDESLPNYFEVDEIAYGDLTADKREEAVIRTLCNTGGTGQFSEGFIFIIKNGKPNLLTRFEGGDRGFGGLQSAKVVRGLLVVKRNDAGEGGANCCAEFIKTTKYRWDQTKLAVVGNPTKRKISFPK